jgi:hypothetical protein
MKLLSQFIVLLGLIRLLGHNASQAVVLSCMSLRGRCGRPSRALLLASCDGWLCSVRAGNTNVGSSLAGFSPRQPAFEPGSGHAEFVVDNVELGRVFIEHFCFPCHLTP